MNRTNSRTIRTMCKLHHPLPNKSTLSYSCLVLQKQVVQVGQTSLHDEDNIVRCCGSNRQSRCISGAWCPSEGSVHSHDVDVFVLVPFHLRIEFKPFEMRRVLRQGCVLCLPPELQSLRLPSGEQESLS